MASDLFGRYCLYLYKSENSRNRLNLNNIHAPSLMNDVHQRPYLTWQAALWHHQLAHTNNIIILLLAIS